MTTTWIISGARSGVGKTHLALKLCDILPNSVYAKRGRSGPKPGKPPNCFKTEKALKSFLARAATDYEHVVVESNGLARSGEGDVIIFVDPLPGQDDIRPDAEKLRSSAHLQVGPGADPDDWERFLCDKLPDAAMRKAVCRALAGRKRYAGRPHASIRSKVWFVLGNTHIFGSGLARLLADIDRFGTLRKAAEAGRVSYRYAWDMIKAAEAHLGKKLIIRQAGGRGGGRSTLSAEGRRLLNLFQRINTEVAEFADQRFAALFTHEMPDE
jgi:molybdate transport system regulatory protein